MSMRLIPKIYTQTHIEAYCVCVRGIGTQTANRNGTELTLRIRNKRANNRLTHEQKEIWGREIAENERNRTGTNERTKAG